MSASSSGFGPDATSDPSAPIRDSSNSALLAQDSAHLIHPLHDTHAHERGRVWIEGRGALLVDADGREYIDGIAGLWNVLAGHGRRELADTARSQCETLAYASAYTGSSNRPAIQLARRLAELTYPSINKFFFTSGGGEATESSIKMARAYWKLRGRPDKTKVISRIEGYHGVTMAAMSATGLPAYWPLFEPRVPGFIHIPSPYPYRYNGPPGVSPGIAAANELEQAILREGADTISMFLAEPVQGAGGVIVPPDDYFPRIREICDQYDVLLVADEVITGFGRTGVLFALDHWNIEPDIVQFAKAITSGYIPFGGIGISDTIAAALDEDGRAWMHAYTYSGHPVGCAVALRNLRIIEEEALPEQCRAKGELLLDALRDSLADHPHVGDIRGKGLMCAVELVADRATKENFPTAEALGIRLQQEAARRGLFSRVKADSFLLAPAAVITKEQLEQAVSILNNSIRALLG